MIRHPKWPVGVSPGGRLSYECTTPYRLNSLPQPSIARHAHPRNLRCRTLSVEYAGTGFRHHVSMGHDNITCQCPGRMVGVLLYIWACYRKWRVLHCTVIGKVVSGSTRQRVKVRYYYLALFKCLETCHARMIKQHGEVLHLLATNSVMSVEVNM